MLAAADGTVRNVRDGMADMSVAIAGPASVKGRECGNGVVIAHADGWETQYCHMAKGSVSVRPGQVVKARQPLGRMGESGDAAFPHLHLSVRHGAEKVDPFAYGGAPGSCGTGASLWTPAAAKALAYRSPQLINWGFADGPVTMEDIEEGRTGARRPASDASAVVAFVRAIGLEQGDVLELSLSGPVGVLADSKPITLDHAKAQYMLFAGSRRPDSGWPPGVYAARFTVTRAGKAVLDRPFELKPTFELKPK